VVLHSEESWTNIWKSNYILRREREQKIKTSKAWWWQSIIQSPPPVKHCQSSALPTVSPTRQGPAGRSPSSAKRNLLAKEKDPSK
jgi:hypothetical protein